MTSTAAAAPSISVVVCAYTLRRAGQVLDCVREAQRQADGPGDEVVLVVDHNDELAAAMAGQVPARVRIVPNSGPRGLSGARNTGVAVTDGDVVVFVDDDAALRPGALTAVRERFTDGDVAALGGAVHARWEGGAAPAWFPPEFGWVVGCDYRGLPGNGAPIRNPIGACMAVRRSALDAVGGFSTGLGRVGTLPVGCEETLMGIEVRRKVPGATILRDEAFAVDHAVSADRQSVRYFLSRCFHEGRSKALLNRAVGAGDGLSSERAYVSRVLPAAVGRELARSLRGDGWGVARAGLVVAGATTTAAGLLSVTPARGARSSARRAAQVGRGPAATSATASSSAAPASSPAPARPPVGSETLVSVVVCTLGRDPRLTRTVRAVLDQTHREVDLVVVDNDPSSGRVRELLADVRDARLRTVAEPVRGLSAARNAGLAAARGDLIAYTDDDAIPDATWVAESLTVFGADRTGAVTCVTGRVLAAETATQEQEWFEQAGIFDKGETRTVWSLAQGAAADLGHPGRRSAFFPYTAGEVGSGNNMVFRTAALRELGGFDEALGAGSPAKGGEDLDIFRRVLLHGDVIVYTPDAVVRHFHRDTYDALRAQMFGYGVGMSAVLTKLLLHGGRPALAVLRLVPQGVHNLLHPTSPKNVKKPEEMPRELLRTELLGYLAGPALYVKSVVVSRRRRAAAAGKGR